MIMVFEDTEPSLKIFLCLALRTPCLSDDSLGVTELTGFATSKKV